MLHWLFEVSGVGVAIIIGAAGLGMIVGRILHDMNPSDPDEGHGPLDEFERQRLERAARFARRVRDDQRLH